MRNENIYCETACCDLRSLRNSGNSYRVLKLPVVLFLPARKMSMERVGQSGLKNLWSPKMLKVGALRLRWWHLVYLCPVCLVSRLFCSLSCCYTFKGPCTWLRWPSLVIRWQRQWQWGGPPGHSPQFWGSGLGGIWNRTHFWVLPPQCFQIGLIFHFNKWSM